MSLSARDQQALHSIEHGLAGSAPDLASLLATFTRLVSGEEMPARERIRAARWRASRRHRRRRYQRPWRAGWSTRTIRLHWQRVLLVLGLALAIALAVVSLATTPQN